MALVDVHVHIYPEKIARKATQSVGDFYNVHMDGDGSVSTLLDMMSRASITHSVVYSVANKLSNVTSINDFIAGACKENDKFIGFMTLHQDMDDFESEINRSMAMGLKGIKLHPDSQRVNLDDERLLPVYEIARDRRLPMVIHCGDYRYDFSHPRRMKRVLQMFPGLVVDAAHFGGWSICDYALEFLEDEDCFVDMSSSQFILGPRRTKELCELYGTERVLFGSDFPMWSPVDELERFSSLGFTDSQLEDMTWHNAERFLGMTIG